MVLALGLLSVFTLKLVVDKSSALTNDVLILARS